MLKNIFLSSLALFFLLLVKPVLALEKIVNPAQLIEICIFNELVTTKQEVIEGKIPHFSLDQAFQVRELPPSVLAYLTQEDLEKNLSQIYPLLITKPNKAYWLNADFLELYQELNRANIIKTNLLKFPLLPFEGQDNRAFTLFMDDYRFLEREAWKSANLQGQETSYYQLTVKANDVDAGFESLAKKPFFSPYYQEGQDFTFLLEVFNGSLFNKERFAKVSKSGKDSDGNLLSSAQGKGLVLRGELYLSQLVWDKETNTCTISMLYDAYNNFRE